MDNEVMKLLAHLDQTRSEMRDIVKGLANDQAVALIKTCAGGRLDELDEGNRLLVGMLAVVCLFDLRQQKPEES